MTSRKCFGDVRRVCSAGLAFVALGCGSGDGVDASGGGFPTGPSPEAPPYSFRAGEGGFEVSVSGRDFEPFWPIGVNYGHAIPGSAPGEFVATREDIASFLEAIGDLGANAVRVYTVQSPIFYEELLRYDETHPERPLFLLQGAWLPEPEADLEGVGGADYLDPLIRAWFQDELEKAVDVVHGSRSIPPGSPENPMNWGRAFGEYTADVSPYLIGWLVGREIEPLTIMSTHAKYYADHCGGGPCDTAYEGEWLSIAGATPIESFVVESMDRLTSYEADHFKETHAIAFSSWPTLDPIDHVAEPPFPKSPDDAEQLDLLKVEVAPSFSSGLFFSYHAYPYYPEFVLYEPSYQVEDDLGPNPYLGYLQDLRQTYAGRTLLVAEIGHPSSQGSAHQTLSGLDHGGLDEREQGEAIERSLRTITKAGIDGAFLFEAIDEWFKRAWVTDRLELPGARRKLWYNAMSPEQNFGLVAMRPGAEDAHHILDGKPDDFANAAVLASQSGPPLAPLDAEDPARTLRSIQVDSDAGFLHILIRVESLDPDGDGKVDWDRVDYLVGIDTLFPDAGDACLDTACALRSERRLEFLLRIDAADDVTLNVDKPYDLYGIWHMAREPWQLYHTEPNEDGLFNLVRSKTNNAFWFEGKELSPERIQKTGRFRVAPESESTNANVFYSIEDAALEIRIPWTLLNVTDPSQRLVVDDHVPGPKGAGVDLETRVTPEIALVVAALGGAGEAETTLVDTLPRATKSGASWIIPAAGTATYTWAPWDEAPPYHRYRKRSFAHIQQALPEIVPETTFHP